MIKNGKIWPIMIGISIFAVVLLGYWTIKETLSADLTESNAYMSKYQSVDENINEIIAKKIAFNKAYRLSYEEIKLSKDGSIIKYKLLTVDGKPVNNAKMKLIISRPVNDTKDITLDKYDVNNGIYRFEKINLPKEGRWDLILKVNIGDKERFYNLKADTRKDKLKEFE